jgi:hypothetical protein
MNRTKSIEEKRTALLAATSGKGEEKVVHVRNDDVEKFLNKLDEYEEEDKKIRFIVK